MLYLIASQIELNREMFADYDVYIDRVDDSFFQGSKCDVNPSVCDKLYIASCQNEEFCQVLEQSYGCKCLLKRPDTHNVVGVFHISRQFAKCCVTDARDENAYYEFVTNAVRQCESCSSVLPVGCDILYVEATRDVIQKLLGKTIHASCDDMDTLSHMYTLLHVKVN